MTTPRDLDLLSTHLDHALSPNDQAALEARLAREPELRAALVDLRVNRRLLRALPAIKPPRNFTLTPAQAEALRRPRGFSLFPALRLATAFAALALAFVLFTDWRTGTLTGGAASAPEIQSAAQSNDAASGGSAEIAASPTSIDLFASSAITEAPPADVALTPSAKAGALEDTATPSAEFSIAAPAMSPPPGVGGSLPEPTPAPMTQDETTRIMVALTETPAVMTDTTHTDSATQVALAPLAENPASAPVAEPGPPATPTLRYVEIALAVLVGALALATWLARR
jgi:hypothetical protein